MRNYNPDDRRYMTFEQRAQDDPRYRGKVESSRPKSRNCGCGKTNFVDSFGSPNSDECPQCGESR